MSIVGVTRISGIALAGVLVLPLALSSTAAGEPGQGDPWVLVDKRGNLDGKGASAIDFSTPEDGWAVGENYVGDNATPWGMHWDGTTWSEVDIGGFANPTLLMNVAAVAPDDAWATGIPQPTSSMSTHRGQQRDTGPLVRDVRGMPVESADARAAEGIPYALAHWDGQKWAPVDAPKPPEGKEGQVSEMEKVAGEIWSVGFENKVGDIPTEQQAFVDRYAGEKWQRLELPEELTSKPSMLFSVTGADQNDVWLSGSFPTPQKDTPFAAHWDGTTFTVTELPVTGDFPNGWNADEIAKLGDQVYVTGRSLYTDQTLATAYRFDGTNWTEWQDRALAEVNDISVAPDGKTMLLGGWPSLTADYSEYAVFDGTTWTNHAQPAELGTYGGQVLDVAHLPDTDRAMAVGYINAEDDGYGYITVNKKLRPRTLTASAVNRSDSQIAGSSLPGGSA